MKRQKIKGKQTMKMQKSKKPIQKSPNTMLLLLAVLLVLIIILLAPLLLNLPWGNYAAGSFYETSGTLGDTQEESDDEGSFSQIGYNMNCHIEEPEQGNDKCGCEIKAVCNLETAFMDGSCNTISVSGTDIERLRTLAGNSAYKKAYSIYVENLGKMKCERVTTTPGHVCAQKPVYTLDSECAESSDGKSHYIKAVSEVGIECREYLSIDAIPSSTPTTPPEPSMTCEGQIDLSCNTDVFYPKIFCIQVESGNVVHPCQKEASWCSMEEGDIICPVNPRAENNCKPLKEGSLAESCTNVQNAWKPGSLPGTGEYVWGAAVSVSGACSLKCKTDLGAVDQNEVSKTLNSFSPENPQEP